MLGPWDQISFGYKNKYPPQKLILNQVSESGIDWKLVTSVFT